MRLNLSLSSIVRTSMTMFFPEETICRETEVPGFGTVPGCSRSLLLHYYVNKHQLSDAVIICPHCDSYDMWPKEKK